MRRRHGFSFGEAMMICIVIVVVMYVIAQMWGAGVVTREMERIADESIEQLKNAP